MRNDPQHHHDLKVAQCAELSVKGTTIDDSPDLGKADCREK